MSKKIEKKPKKATGKTPARPAARTAAKSTAKSTAKQALKTPKTTKVVATPKSAVTKPAPAAKTAPVVKSHNGKHPPAVPPLPKAKPLPRSAAIFKVGDHVVYPFHGVGVIKTIEKLNITGEDQWYYNLDFRNGELTVKLPVSQQSEKGMRKVIVRADVEKVMVVLKKKPPSEESDWKVRHNAYLEDLKSGDIYKAAKVARNLSKRGPEGELSMSEKRLLEAAVQQLVQEIAEASREPIEKVETEISKCLRAGRV